MTRREWIALVWPAVLAAQEHAHRMADAGAAAALEHFDARTAADVEALAEQILPSGGSPGAREAGVIYFIDRALATFDQDKQLNYRDGLSEFQEIRKEMFPGSDSIASLSSAEQLRLMAAIDRKPFFQLLRLHTLMGFLCDPSYGGNRNEAGWRLIGFEDKFVFQAPFGYYDKP